MIARYIGLLANAERALADALSLIGLRHAVEPDIRRAAKTYAAWCRAHVDALDPAIARYGASRSTDGERLRRALFRGPRLGGFGLLRDLHDLVTLATAVREGWTALHQAARESHDHELAVRCRACGEQTTRMIAWLARMRIGQAVRHDGPQTHLIKAGTPTMGGALILVAIIAATLLWGDLGNRFVWIVLAVTAAFGLIGQRR